MSKQSVNSDEIRKSNKTEPSKVKANDVMQLIYYVKVKDVRNGGETLNVTDLVGDTGSIQVNGKSLIQNSQSADQFAETIKVTKTQAAQLLIDSTNRPFTVVFEKQDGTERTLRGRLLSHEALLGRSMVEDLDIDQKDPKGRTRLVDHRTLKSLIVDGVKYEVKDK